MTLRSLASQIAKREGKKSQARIGDIREILGILSDIILEESQKNGAQSIEDLFIEVVDHARKRAKKKKK